MLVIKDSGQRHQFDSGAVRDMREGKGRCDLLPAAAILRVAKLFEAGAKKYGDRNWEKGIPLWSFIDSALRHLLKYMDGQTDEDHLCAAAWNLLCAMWTEEKMKSENKTMEIHLYECGRIWEKENGHAPEGCPVCQELSGVVAMREALEAIFAESTDPGARDCARVVLRATKTDEKNCLATDIRNGGR